MLQNPPMSRPPITFEGFWAYVERLASAPSGPALVELARDGSRREFGFSEVVLRSGALSGELARRGVKRGDVVLTLVGNRPEWVFAMLACWRMGAVVLPCNEMLRAKDLRHRIEQASIANTHSGRLPTNVSTTPPRFTPRRASSPLKAPERITTSEKPYSWREPSRASSTSASPGGAAAIRSTKRQKLSNWGFASLI